MATAWPMSPGLIRPTFSICIFHPLVCGRAAEGRPPKVRVAAAVPVTPGEIPRWFCAATSFRRLRVALAAVLQETSCRVHRVRVRPRRSRAWNAAYAALTTAGATELEKAIAARRDRYVPRLLLPAGARTSAQTKDFGPAPAENGPRARQVAVATRLAAA